MHTPEASAWLGTPAQDEAEQGQPEDLNDPRVLSLDVLAVSSNPGGNSSISNSTISRKLSSTVSLLKTSSVAGDPQKIEQAVQVTVLY